MKTRIIIVTALWGRAELTSVVLSYYRNLQQSNHPKIEFILLCVGSEKEHSENLARRNGWNYTEAPNAPLSQKFNRLFQAANTYEFDLLVLVGSDDLISLQIFEWYAANVPATHPNLVGLTDLYFYSIQDDMAILFPGYPPPSPRTIGAGRCFSRHILEIMQFRPWQDEILPRGLDSASSRQMRKRDIGEESYTMEQMGGIGLDIKDPMVSLTRWGLIGDPARQCDVGILDSAFPLEMGLIRQLKKDFVFLPWEEYDVVITEQTHELYGKTMKVKGEVAIELAIKKIIAYP